MSGKIYYIGLGLSLIGEAISQIITTESPTFAPSTSTTPTSTSTTTSLFVGSDNSTASFDLSYWGMALIGTGIAAVCLVGGYLIGRYCQRTNEVAQLDFHEDVPDPVAPPPSPELEEDVWARRLPTRPIPEPYDTAEVRRWLESFDEETTMETQM